MRKHQMPDFSIEDEFNNLPGLITGVDEAGRGPWAGPVVAGAVILDRGAIDDVLINGLDDSKKLKPEKREELFAALQECAVIGVGVADVDGNLAPSIAERFHTKAFTDYKQLFNA